MDFLSALLSLADNDDKRMAVWRELASAHHLHFIPASLISEPQVVGDYQGYSLKLSASGNSRTSNNSRRTYVELSVNTPPTEDRFPRNKKYWEEPLTVKTISRMLIPSGLTYRMRGWIKVKAKGQKVYYKQSGFETDLQYLRFVFNLLSHLADNYPKVIALGGEAVPVVQTITRDGGNVLQAVASQLLVDIADETTARLKHQVTSLLCPRCLAHPGPYKIVIAWGRTVTYYGCRSCSQSREFLAKPAIAVLDSGMETEQAEQDRGLRVNWLRRRKLFDFSEVQIVQATDREVEEFAVKVGNDTDKERKKHYSKMGCTVAAPGELSENTMRILKHTFGQVIES